jgi:hypothetical protein
VLPGGLLKSLGRGVVFDATSLIAEHLAVRDDLTLLRQLGALPHDQARQ